MAKDKEQVEETQAAEAPAQEAVAQEPVNITIADMQALVNLIDVASSRGAFRGPELTAVGTLYTKLATFLQQVVGAAQAQQEAEKPEEADAS